MIKLLDGMIKLLFPPRCIFCSSIMDINSDTYICKSCFSRIPFLEAGIIRNVSPALGRGNCDYAVCVCRYEGIVRDSVKRFKFHDRPGYYRAFALLLAERLKKMTNISEFDIITCVPLHKSKESMRGYNQSRLISAELGRKLGIPVDNRLLSRERHTGSQSLKTRYERFINVSGAFRVNRRDSVKGRTVLLVDDVMTTGSTLEECSRVLKEAGAKKVVGAVIATGRSSDLK